MSGVREVLTDLIRVLACILDKSNEEIEVFRIYYNSDDFKGQDYVLNKSGNTYSGQFHVPLSDVKGNHAGWLRWDSSATKPEVGQDEWSVLEQIDITDGIDHNHPAYTGVALSKTTKGYYALNKPYVFYVRGSEGNARVTIKKIDSKKREVTFKKLQ